MWSASGRALLFALESECVLYSLRFTQAAYSLEADCQVVTDLGTEEGCVGVGVYARRICQASLALVGNE